MPQEAAGVEPAGEPTEEPAVADFAMLGSAKERGKVVRRGNFGISRILGGENYGRGAFVLDTTCKLVYGASRLKLRDTSYAASEHILEFK